ncbi:MAG: hypothetical protein S0880_06535 [Actinomycetota bacterium]|nr:hypothetical protein [Actinomycetota bacterium]
MTEPTVSDLNDRRDRTVTFTVPDEARSMPTRATIHARTAAELIAEGHDVHNPPEAA